MDAEFAALEEKIKQTAALCRQLRDENRDLRVQLATLGNDRKQLTEKLDSARSRLETLLKQIPE
jgi:cell division protein ZapB